MAKGGGGGGKEGARSIRVVDILGIKSGAPANLSIEAKEQSGQGVKQPRWQARWGLPKAFRPPLATGQRRHQHTRRSTGLAATVENIKPACSIALELYQEALKTAVQNQGQQTYQKKVLLLEYWEKYIESLRLRIRNGSKRVKNPEKYLRDKEALWRKKDGSGVGDQNFARIDIREIDQRAGDRYQEMLRDKGLSKTHIANHKTLLTELVELAGRDYPQIPKITYSVLTDAKKSNPQEEYFFTREQWETICNTIAEQSQDYARKQLTRSEYLDLPHGWKRDSIRNWVDFYDLCRLMEYCHLRTQDLSEIKVSDFRIENEGTENEILITTIRNPKKNARSHPIACMSHDGVRLWKRIRTRFEKKDDYVLFSHLKESERRESHCKFNTLKTHLLSLALEMSGLPKTNAYGNHANFTSMRHTGFMLHLDTRRRNGESLSDLDLKHIADNGLTSVDMLKDVYLSHIDRMEFSRQSVRRSRESPNRLLLIKRSEEFE